jgi:hypothetical protein
VQVPGSPWRAVTQRSYTAPDGRTWVFRPRPEVRQEEAGTHVTLLVESLGWVRVVSCLRSEWESPAPDLARLLARAVPVGASRGVGAELDPPEER